MGMEIGIRVPSPTAPKLWAEYSSNIGVVAPTGFEPVFQSRPRFRHVSPILARWSRVRESTRLKHARCIEARPAQAWPGYCELADQEQLARKRRGFHTRPHLSPASRPAHSRRSAIGLTTVRATRRVGSRSLKVESACTPKASRSLLKKQRAAAAAATSKISSS